MSLSSNLISQFVKITNDDKKKEKETIVYGTTAEYGGAMYVKLDGSDILTPITSTTALKNNERVIVMIKNHQAAVTGNVTSPSASSSSVEAVTSNVAKLQSDLDNNNSSLMASEGYIDDLQAADVEIKRSLTAAEANITDLKAKDVEIEGKITAVEGSIDNLEAENIEIKGTLEATNADIDSLQAKNIDIEGKVTAVEADIASLQTDKLDVETAKITYANIDFSNIGKAAMEYLYSESGLIENVTIGDGTITGQIVGVTISGDLIEGNTIVANKLVIKGTDGLYYKLNTDGVTTESEQTNQNSLNGSVIKAKSITATKISVSDLVAFDATIGGFNISEGSLYSGVKSAIENSTSGIHLDSDGQAAIGDGTNYIKYYKDADGNFKLAISAESIVLSTSGKNIDEALSDTNTIAEQANDVADRAESLIQQLTDSISTLVTDGNGTSLMVQTDDGWTFSTSEIQMAIDLASENLNALTNELGDATNTIGVLQQAVDDLGVLADYIKIGTYEDEPCIELGEGDSDFKLFITNTRIIFMEGSSIVAYINNQSLHIKKAIIEEELQQGEFVWKIRSNGNMGLVWKGVTS